MTSPDTLRAALLTAVRSETWDSPEVAVDALANVIAAAQDLNTIAAGQNLILAGLRKQTALLEVLAKQGEHMRQYISDGSDPLRMVDVSGLPG